MKTNRSMLIFLGIFLVLSVMGIWHALPNIDVVGDESGYVGGVLRAMQAHTVKPDIGDAYLISFFASYILMVPVVVFFLAIAHFSITQATAILYAHYDLLYLVPRLVSVLASVGIAFVFLRLSRLLGHPKKITYAVVALILSTVILATVMHTGKMWPLSGLLILLANYLCISACIMPPREAQPWYRSSIFWSIGFVFIGIANFPLCGIAIVVLPILWQRFRDSASRRRIVLFTVIWTLIAALLIIFDLHGWLVQDAGTPVGQSPSALANIGYQAFLLVAMMPFLLLAMIAQIGTSLERRLFFLAGSELVLYLSLLVIRAPWTDGTLDSLRYGLITTILLGLMLLATSLKRRTVIYVLLAISLVFYAQTLRLLAVPTTYNEARDWVVATLALQQVEVVNTVSLLDLPKTPQSFSLVYPNLCESTCTVSQQYGFDSSYKYLVIDKETNPASLAGLHRVTNAAYLITDEATTSSAYQLVRSFGDDPNLYFAVDYRAGIYDPRYLLAKQFGSVVYIYRFVAK